MSEESPLPEHGSNVGNLPTFNITWVLDPYVITITTIIVFFENYYAGRDTYEHSIRFTRPTLQRLSMRIILMVPIYASLSCMALWWPDRRFVIVTVRDTYESFVLYEFLALLIAYCGGEAQLIHALQIKRYKGEHPPPCCCLPLFPLDRDFYLRCKRLVLQYALIKPVTSLLAIFLAMNNSYRETDFDFATNVYPWFMVINNVSITYSLWYLVVFHNETERELAYCRPMLKFLCIKFIIFFAFWQSLGIAILVSMGVLDGGPTHEEREHSQGALQDWLIIVELIPVALMHHYAFGYESFEAEMKDEPVWERTTTTTTTKGRIAMAAPAPGGGSNIGLNHNNSPRGATIEMVEVVVADESSSKGETNEVAAAVAAKKKEQANTNDLARILDAVKREKERRRKEKEMNANNPAADSSAPMTPAVVAIPRRRKVSDHTDDDDDELGMSHSSSRRSSADSSRASSIPGTPRGGGGDGDNNSKSTGSAAPAAAADGKAKSKKKEEDNKKKDKVEEALDRVETSVLREALALQDFVSDTVQTIFYHKGGLLSSGGGGGGDDEDGGGGKNDGSDNDEDGSGGGNSHQTRGKRKIPAFMRRRVVASSVAARSSHLNEMGAGAGLGGALASLAEESDSSTDSGAEDVDPRGAGFGRSGPHPAIGIDIDSGEYPLFFDENPVNPRDAPPSSLVYLQHQAREAEKHTAAANLKNLIVVPVYDLVDIAKRTIVGGDAVDEEEAAAAAAAAAANEPKLSRPLSRLTSFRGGNDSLGSSMSVAGSSGSLSRFKAAAFKAASSTKTGTGAGATWQGEGDGEGTAPPAKSGSSSGGVTKIPILQSKKQQIHPQNHFVPTAVEAAAHEEEHRNAEALECCVVCGRVPAPEQLAALQMAESSPPPFSSSDSSSSSASNNNNSSGQRKQGDFVMYKNAYYCKGCVGSEPRYYRVAGGGIGLLLSNNNSNSGAARMETMEQRRARWEQGGAGTTGGALGQAAMN